MDIIILGGKKHAKKIERHFTSSSTLDWKYTYTYEKVTRQVTPFQTITNHEPIVETYYLRFITRGDITKVFYVWDKLELDLIKNFSKEFWEETAVAGYSFDSE